MAKATRDMRVVTREVTTTEPVIILELTKEEAAAVAALTGRISGGSTTHSYRKHSYAVHKALVDVNGWSVVSNKLIGEIRWADGL